MSLKTLSIGALARAMASTAVIGAVSFGASVAVAQTQDQINALKVTIESTITQTIADTLASNPNATEDEIAEAVAAAVANVTNNVDPALAVAAISAVKADTTFMASLPSNIASAGTDIALSAVRTTIQANAGTGGTGATGGGGQDGGSDFGGTGGATGGGGGGGGQHGQ